VTDFLHQPGQIFGCLTLSRHAEHRPIKTNDHRLLGQLKLENSPLGRLCRSYFIGGPHVIRLPLHKSGPNEGLVCLQDLIRS